MPKKYFPTVLQSNENGSVSCPLDRICPEEIKRLYSRELNKDIIQRGNYYKLVAMTLGFEEWKEYSDEYATKLVLFLEQHGLITYALDAGKDILSSADIGFSYRQVSDRLFLSDQEIPQAIFTGYNCQTDYIHHYIQRDIVKQLSSSFASVLEIPKIYLHQAEAYYKLLSTTSLDLLFPMLADEFMALHNLLGDLFVKNKTMDDDQHVAALYIGNHGLIEQDHYVDVAKAFKKILLEMNKGWIEVIPYTDNLIFLKANDGTYDFVFRNLREGPFVSPYGDHINQTSLPSLLNEKYDFERWCYFGYKEKKKNIKKMKMKPLWKERDEHLAEIAFYKNKSLEDYPGSLEVLKDYYTKSDDYAYTRKNAYGIIEGFNKIDIDNTTLCVSQLITVDEFSDFYEGSYSQNRSSTLEDIKNVNIESGNPPVSVTWFDAIEYCKYLSDKYGVAMRLLTKDEFYSFAPTYIDNQALTYDLGQELDFYYHGEKLHWPLKAMSDFEEVIMRNKKPYDLVEQYNLRFPINSTFREWTNDYRGELADTFSVRATGNKEYDQGMQTRYLASSTNKYKYKKIGFRVCYEVKKDTAC